MAVGGGTAVLPEMQTLLAHQFQITHTQFVHIYSIGQVAPDPNMLMVLIIGFKIAGIIGAGIVLLAFLCHPVFCASMQVVYRTVLQIVLGDALYKDALEPISIGLMDSGVYAVAKASIVSPTTFVLAITALYLIMRTKINPVFVILGSDLLFYFVTNYLQLH